MSKVKRLVMSLLASVALISSASTLIANADSTGFGTGTSTSTLTGGSTGENNNWGIQFNPSEINGGESALAGCKVTFYYYTDPKIVQALSKGADIDSISC